MEFVLAALVLGCAIVVHATLTKPRAQQAPKPVESLKTAIEQQTEAMTSLLTSTHAAHQANCATLQKRVDRLQVERDHYLQLAHSYRGELERLKVNVEMTEPAPERVVDPEGPMIESKQVLDGVEG